ncbi:MAG: DUF6316 family protein [Pseudomonadales bacterium]
MPQLPNWFAADRVYRAAEGWFIGSPTSFRVGPYPRQAAAEQRSREITEELLRCSNVGEMVRTVRTFLSRENAAAKESATAAPAPPRPASGAAKPPAAVMGSVDVPAIRTGEDAAVRFRTNRYFAVGEAWFFATRENIDVGPYASRAAAERDAECLLGILQQTETESLRRIAVYQFKLKPAAVAAH